MGEIPDGSVDMVMADLPYGTTACKWDTVIPFEPLWAHYRRVTKPNAAIVLTACQPFTTALIASNLREFRYEWIWAKNNATGFANANRMPMRAHENIVVFYRSLPTYNKQPTASLIRDRKLGGSNGTRQGGDTAVYGGLPRPPVPMTLKQNVAPRSVLEFDVAPRAKGTLHPTQKPVALMEYLIRTYTNEGETVLDNTAGSFTTGVACLNTGRIFIGIERDPDYFRIGVERMRKREAELRENAVKPTQTRLAV